MFPLSLEARLIAGALAVVALIAALWGVAHHFETLGAAQVRADQAAQELAGERAARAESDRRIQAIQEKADHADLAASAARADADAARTADQRLRLRLAAAERGRAASHPGAADPGASAASATDLYADVLARTLEAARLIGDFADQSHIAGQACEQSYRALSVK